MIPGKQDTEERLHKTMMSRSSDTRQCADKVKTIRLWRVKRWL